MGRRMRLTRAKLDKGWPYTVLVNHWCEHSNR